jgi:uncharacterized protein YndB with AHSA1/START domain
MSDEKVSVSRDINAPADKVYALISDITRMGEWSPENTGGEWKGGATGPAPGAKFTGKNRSGWRRWSTSATVVDADPGKRFSFKVDSLGMSVAEWSYDFTPNATGCTVTEAWTDRRPGFSKPFASLLTGVGDRAEHNRKGMEQTLEGLAAAAEAEAKS